MQRKKQLSLFLYVFQSLPPTSSRPALPWYISYDTVSDIVGQYTYYIILLIIYTKFETDEMQLQVTK